MSVYGYLNCHDCRQTLWLGKALQRDYCPFAFHIGGAEEPPHWARLQLNQVLWKFLADHTGHRIDVGLEDTQDELPEGYHSTSSRTATARRSASRRTSPGGRGWWSAMAHQTPPKELRICRAVRMVAKALTANDLG